MGKIRVKTLGIEELEEQQKEKGKVKKEQKALRLAQGKKLAKGAHGGERLVSMAPTEEELARVEVAEETKETEETKEKEAKKKSAKEKKKHSKRYTDALLQIDRSRLYSLSEALDLLKKISATKFDSSVELHINTVEKGISGQVTLPHGSGKTVRVAIANPDLKGPAFQKDGPSVSFDELIKNIEAGKIDFDVLIATPSAMPNLAKVAKILGPRGLMPNPKAGTISDTPEKLAEKFKGGQMHFKTESQASIIHTVVGKLSFQEKDLADNIMEFLKAIGSSKIRSVTLKSTMSPGIKLDLQNAFI